MSNYTGNIYCCGGEDSKGKPLLKVEKISFEDANEKNLCPVQEDEKKFARFGASAVKGGEEQTVFLLGKCSQNNYYVLTFTVKILRDIT